MSRADFREAMAGAKIQIEAIEFLQFLDFLQAGLAEGTLSVKSMEDDAFEEVAEGQIVVVGEGAQDFEEALFHAHSGLHAFDDVFVFLRHLCFLYLGTKLPD